jgi:hypothetical protein
VKIFSALALFALFALTYVLADDKHIEVPTPNATTWAKVAPVLQADFECRDRAATDVNFDVLNALNVNIPLDDDEFYLFTIYPPKNFLLFGKPPMKLDIYFGPEGTSYTAGFRLPLEKLATAAGLKKTSWGTFGREVKHTDGSYWLSVDAGEFRVDDEKLSYLDCSFKNWVE